MSSTKQCSKCRTLFECCNDSGGCWCEGHIVTIENLELLKIAYANCLCPQCLSGYANVSVTIASQ